MRFLVLIAHNLRSCHNVGSLLRTADGLGVEKVYLTGYTPFPAATDDGRLPHERIKIDKQIHKTALGAEKTVKWSHQTDIVSVIRTLKRKGYTVGALEQSKHSHKLQDYHPPMRMALVVGREVEGLEPEILTQCDVTIEIPMLGSKESFNVAQAAAMALYHMRFDTT